MRCHIGGLEGETSTGQASTVPEAAWRAPASGRQSKLQRNRSVSTGQLSRPLVQICLTITTMSRCVPDRPRGTHGHHCTELAARDILGLHGRTPRWRYQGARLARSGRHQSQVNRAAGAARPKRQEERQKCRKESARVVRLVGLEIRCGSLVLLGMGWMCWQRPGSVYSVYSSIC